MFDKMIPIVHKDSLIIFDINNTLITNPPYQFTDLEGFIKLFKHVKGRIVFLTAETSKKETQRQLKEVGLKYDDFTVLHTNIPKGIFLKQYSYPSHTVFIDDRLHQIRSVRKHCPDIQCIHFKSKKQS